MAPTRDVTETIRERIRSDPAVADAMLEQIVECLHAGEVNVGRILLLDYVHAVMGFEQLSRLTGQPSDSLEHMLETDSNQADNFLEIISIIRQHKDSQIKTDDPARKPVSIT